MFKHKLSIVQTIAVSIAIALAILLGSFVAFLVTNLIKRTEQNIENNKNSYIESKKNLIKNQVNLTIDFINYQRSQFIKTDSVSTKALQEDILNQIAKIRFEDEGYIFVVSYDGTTLMNDVQRYTIGGNQWNITDPDGVKIVQEEREAVENPNGDFIYYSWYKPNADKPTPKISFVRGIPEWEWMIGTGIYLEDIETIVSKENELLNDQLKRYVALILASFVLLMVMLLLINRIITKKVQASFDVFANFFKDAAIHSSRIDLAKLHFTEFVIPALSANQMIDELEKAKYELLALNKELEKRVEERTQEIIQQKEEIQTQNEEIRAQRDELERHRNYLSEIIEERTRDLIEAKERAEESDRLKTAFLANISHEIRTPLNAIQGFSSIIVNEDLDEDTRQELVDTIILSSNSLVKIIEDIIDVSKIQTGQLTSCSVEFQVNSILNELYHKCIEQIRIQRKFDVQVVNKSSDMDSVTINSDPYRVKQIIWNLLDNALKYTDNGFVEFGYRVDNQWIVFYVKDTGRGIPAEQQKNLFVQFSKENSNSEQLYQGVGLGLNLCKGVVDILGGEIWLESEVNSGSTFYLKLPR